MRERNPGMATAFAERLKQLGHTLPEPPPALANYMPLLVDGELVYASGHGPFRDGRFSPLGKVGANLSVEDGIEAARASVLSPFSTLHDHSIDIETIRILKLQVFVNSAADFVEQHLVANGASDLVVEVLGERGRHPRTAIGVGALPLDIPVEIDATLRLDQ
jgi:enamine deaminase RidA (YjgF/YER057c/UK114 family)